MTADAVPADRVVAGRYALAGVLGRGGMGVVWAATDQLLERQVAVKEVTFSLDLDAEDRRILRERTLREARAAARLHHPCVTAVYDVVEERGKPWLIMELVAARSLQELLTERGALPPAAVAQIGLDVLAALEAAHAAGIVHRDVKPANVLVDAAGRARLTDFGIATTAGDPTLTGGALIGSPPYMAPERVNGQSQGPAVDLWSLGATLYAAVEGRPPFERGEAMATLMAVVTEEPPPPEHAGPLEPALRGLLTKDPALRSTAAQARADLEAALSGAAAWPPPDPSASARSGPGKGRGAPGSPAGPRASATGRHSVAVLSAEDLRSLAAASRAALGLVVSDAREQARSRKQQRREDAARREGAKAALDRERAAQRRDFRRRLTRRLVRLVLLVLLLVLLLVAGAVLLVARSWGWV